MSEAYAPGRTKEQALQVFREMIVAAETEPVIDMYERAAWLSGATRAETKAVSEQARGQRGEKNRG